MLDNDIWKALIPIIKAGFVGQDQPDVAVKQNYQPERTGADSGPTLYLVKLFDRRLGSPQRSTAPDPDAPLGVIRREVQWYESTFQATGIFKQTAEDTDGLTASDVANLGAAIMQMEATMDALRAAGLAVLRVTTVRNPQFVNGGDEFEASPSFDFILTHEQITLSKTAAAASTDFRAYPV